VLLAIRSSVVVTAELRQSGMSGRILSPVADPKTILL